MVLFDQSVNRGSVCLHLQRKGLISQAPKYLYVCLQSPKSYQFIHESERIFMQTLKKIPLPYSWDVTFIIKEWTWCPITLMFDQQPPNPIHLSLSLSGHVCKFLRKSSLSYLVHKNGPDGQPKNILPPALASLRGGIKRLFLQHAVSLCFLPTPGSELMLWT